MNLTDKLKELLKAENISQYELAKKMNTNRQSLNDSFRRDMRISKFEKIVNALGYEVMFVRKLNNQSK
jgi:transcriptional regulator with XRE-family HTH domain